MTLHEVLNEKLSNALAPQDAPAGTMCDINLPSIPGKIHAVIGMRRTGKTTFLRQLAAARRAGASAESAVYLSFDDDRLSGLPVEQLGFLLEEFYRRYPERRGTSTVSWFFDEIQLVEGWERFLRRVMDTENAEIVVSGSSAKMLSREVHTSLRGRGIATVVRPFSFREFLRHRGEEPVVESRRWTAAKRSSIERRFREYLVQGGFPEVQDLDNGLRVELIQSYIDTVLFRDIIERYQVPQVAALRWIVRQCLRNPAGTFSVHRLHQDLKSQALGIAKDAVHAIIEYLVDAFLISRVPIATESERQRNSNPQKFFPADPGIIHAFDVSGRSNVGHALETAVFNELERRNADISYVKTKDGFEVDFLARYSSGDAELIQVCADTRSAETLARELRALDAARSFYPDVDRRLLVLDRDAASTVKAPGIIVEAAHEWMLRRKSER